MIGTLPIRPLAIAAFVALFLIFAPSSRAESDHIPSTRFDPAKHWRSSDLRTGMKGYGLTVFRGTQIERFEIEILGVLQNEFSDTDLVIAMCSGGPLEKTGVIAGMSGSPIFIEDKLVGALAYAWAYSKDPIAGITPIENMLPVLDLPPSERQVASSGVSLEGDVQYASAGLTDAMRDSTSPDWSRRVRAFLAKDYPSAFSGATSSAAPAEQSEIGQAGWSPEAVSWWSEPFGGPMRTGANKTWIPLSTPISVSGGSSALFERARDLLSPTGFLPVQSGGGTSAHAGDVKLEPGSALGVALVTGDLQLTGIGTVTYVDGERVLGFGHPMFQDGSTDLPMTTAFIDLVLPSTRISTKMGGMVDVVGVLEQDRLPAIGGVVGGKPNTVPMKVRIKNPETGFNQEFNYSLAQHRFFTSRFSMVSVLNAYDVAARAFRDSASDYQIRIQVKDHPPIILKDHVSSTGGTSFDLALTVGLAVDILMQNPYERVWIESIDVDIAVVDQLRQASIEWMRVDKEAVEPGETVMVSVGIQPFLGEMIEVRHPLTIPVSTEPGPIQVGVSDAVRFITELQRQNPDEFRIRSLGDTIELMNRIYRNDQVFLHASAITSGASFNGQTMSDLPSSVLRVMSDSPERGTGMLLMSEPLIEDRVGLGTPLVGNQVLVLNVIPKRSDRFN